MNMVARAMAFVKMAVAAKVQQVELVDQALALEHVECAIDGDARDVANRVSARGREFRPRRDGGAPFPSLAEMTRRWRVRRMPRVCQLLLEMARGLVDVDAFAGGNAMCRCGGHDLCGYYTKVTGEGRQCDFGIGWVEFEECKYKKCAPAANRPRGRPSICVSDAEPV